MGRRPWGFFRPYWATVVKLFCPTPPFPPTLLPVAAISFLPFVAKIGYALGPAGSGRLNRMQDRLCCRLVAAGAPAATLAMCPTVVSHYSRMTCHMLISPLTCGSECSEYSCARPMTVHMLVRAVTVLRRCAVFVTLAMWPSGRPVSCVFVRV